MNHRLNNATFSEPYIVALKNVGQTDIQFDESQEWGVLPAEIENDRRLLDKFVLPIMMTKKLRTNIPNILEQANLARAAKPFSLYNGNTCKEFHALLLELLERFRKGLSGLSNSRGTGKNPTEGSAKFKKHLNDV
jgi:hypothetical protein